MGYCVSESKDFRNFYKNLGFTLSSQGLPVHFGLLCIYFTYLCTRASLSKLVYVGMDTCVPGVWKSEQPQPSVFRPLPVFVRDGLSNWSTKLPLGPEGGLLDSRGPPTSSQLNCNTDQLFMCVLRILTQALVSHVSASPTKHVPPHPGCPPPSCPLPFSNCFR